MLRKGILEYVNNTFAIQFNFSQLIIPQVGAYFISLTPSEENF